MKYRAGFTFHYGEGVATPDAQSSRDDARLFYVPEFQREAIRASATATSTSTQRRAFQFGRLAARGSRFAHVSDVILAQRFSWLQNIYLFSFSRQTTDKKLYYNQSIITPKTQSRVRGVLYIVETREQQGKRPKDNSNLIIVISYFSSTCLFSLFFSFFLLFFFPHRLFFPPNYLSLLYYYHPPKTFLKGRADWME